eukprot:6212589-Pleurochrysis_carterae.AAC.1
MWRTVDGSAAAARPRASVVASVSLDTVRSLANRSDEGQARHHGHRVLRPAPRSGESVRERSRWVSPRKARIRARRRACACTHICAPEKHARTLEHAHDSRTRARLSHARKRSHARTRAARSHDGTIARANARTLA